MVVVVVSGSQRLLSLNPTTVMVVLLLGLGLLLGCDKNEISFSLDLTEISLKTPNASEFGH